MPLLTGTSFGDGRRIFTVGELWGPMHCEHIENGLGMCGKESWSILLTKEENKSLPEESGPIAIVFIFKNRIGKALCHEHLPKN